MFKIDWEQRDPSARQVKVTLEDADGNVQAYYADAALLGLYRDAGGDPDTTAVLDGEGDAEVLEELLTTMTALLYKTYRDNGIDNETAKARIEYALTIGRLRILSGGGIGKREGEPGPM